MLTILIIILLLGALGAFPRWGHSRNWGYGPSGLLTVVLVILVIMALTRPAVVVAPAPVAPVTAN